jgi:phospholipid/cholesterol/gamma-HCH transport system substrate-binding protein
MRRNFVETIIGGLVLLVAALFLFYAYTGSNLRGAGGYDLIARFNRVDGLANGAEVRLSGIKIGSVVRQDLDPKTYLAVVHLAINDNIKLPIDSTAKIQSDSLLSGSHVNLEPGGDEKTMANGDEIKYTQDPVNLGDLIGRFIFSSAQKAGAKDGDAGGAGGTPPAATPPAAPAN